MIEPIAPHKGYLNMTCEFHLDNLKESLTTLQRDLEQISELREAETLSSEQAAHETHRYMIHIVYLTDLIALYERNT